MIEGEICAFLDGFFIEPLDPVTECVVTPFVDRNGFPIRVFIRKRGGQFYLFHEKGRIVPKEDSARKMPHDRRERLRAVLRRFDVYHINGEITTEATAESLPLRFRNMLQALVVLDTMF